MLLEITGKVLFDRNTMNSPIVHCLHTDTVYCYCYCLPCIR